MSKINNLGRIDNQDTLVNNSEHVEPIVDPHFILLDCVNESVQDETIRLYLTIILNPTLDTSFKIEYMRRNYRRCLVKLIRPCKIKEVLERRAKVPDLAGTTIVLSEVRTPDTIRVTGLSNSCNKEILNLYFSNSKMSGGGDIRNIKVYDYKALVQFQDYTK